MFGYFRFNQIYASPRIKRVYKNYYCGTCFSLEYNYGEISRFILSYDVVILALAAKLHKYPEDDLLPCFFRKKEKLQFIENEDWRKLAAINVLLMGAKIDDDINDEQSTKAKAASIACRKMIKKAEMQYPELAYIIRNGYKEMYKLELEKVDMLEICDAFSSLMCKLMTNAYEINLNKLKFISAISRWLYFIDQLDDYDDDIKERKFNPLIIKGLTKSQMINKEHDKLFSYMKELFKEFQDIKNSLDLSCVEDRLLYSVSNESIPSVTSLVLKDKQLPKIIHKRKEIEWKTE